MPLGGFVLVADHNWLLDQRDTLENASEAASVAATQVKADLLERDPDIMSNNMNADQRSARIVSGKGR